MIKVTGVLGGYSGEYVPFIKMGAKGYVHVWEYDQYNAMDMLLSTEPVAYNFDESDDEDMEAYGDILHILKTTDADIEYALGDGTVILLVPSDAIDMDL